MARTAAPIKGGVVASAAAAMTEATPVAEAVAEASAHAEAFSIGAEVEGAVPHSGTISTKAAIASGVR